MACRGIDYGPQLIVYSILFLALCLVTLVLWKRQKLHFHPDQAGPLITVLLGSGLLLRVYAATLMTGHPFDISLFKNWATAAAHNLWQVYASSPSIDYPPLYMYILFLVGKLASIQALSPYFTLLIKLPSLLADIATSFLIYKLASKYLTRDIGILVSAFYIFNPAVFINSTFWGQVDSFFTLLVVAAVWLLSEKKSGLASVLFTAAVLMKPQGIIFLPVLFFELVRSKSVKAFIQAAALALSTAVLTIFPFTLIQGGRWIFNLFAHTVGEYPYASVNAFNLFSLLGSNYQNDASTLWLFSYHSWGMIFIVMITLFTWLVYIKGNNPGLASGAALLLIAGVFTFSSRMHERYLFPAVALAIIAFIYLRDNRLLLAAVGLSATVYANTHYVLFNTNGGFNTASFGPILICTSILNVVLFFYLTMILFDIATMKKPVQGENFGSRDSLPPDEPETPVPQTGIISCPGRFQG